MHSVIAEKIPLNIDLQKVIESLRPILQKHAPIQRSRAVGGWALQSTNGEYSDGWSMEFCPYNGPDNLGPTWTPETEIEKKLKAIQDYTLPTEISTPPIENVLNQLAQMGFNPRKARIIRLTANSESSWHQDGSEKFYQVRLHIPLVTNPGCFFETHNGRFHMAADGSAYLVHINRMHRIVNEGTTDRFHFVVNVWDSLKITKFHQYDLDRNMGETIHPPKV